jgi:uncharacterized membrane protein YgcG
MRALFVINQVLELDMSACFSRGVAVTKVRGVLVRLLCCGLVFAAITAFAEPVTASDSNEARMATFDSASGTHFALSVKADFEGQPKRASDVVVYVDTSASQNGVFREDSIVALEKFLDGLNADDRVKIMAVDLDPVPLTDEFVRADSQEVDRAIDRLQARVPLGSTDMKLMLVSAPDQFESAAVRNRNVVYIGDGISRAGIVHTEALNGIVDRLVKNQISVSSFAIGPDRNMELLAILANHTGGNLYIDTDRQDSAAQAAAALADTVHDSVFWPQDNQITESVVESFPSSFPPLRSDRDSILIGTMVGSGDVELKVGGRLNGRRVEQRYEIRPEVSNKHYSFLPKMVRDARRDNGLTLPTAGSSGLMEYARVLGFRANAITSLGKQALEQGNIGSAQRLATAAMIVDPENKSAQVLAKSASYVAKKKQDDSPFGEDLFGGDSGETAEVVPDNTAESSPFGGAEESDSFPPADSPEGDGDLFGSPEEDMAVEESGDAPMESEGVVMPDDFASEPEVLPFEEPRPVETVSPLPEPTVISPSDDGLNLIGRPVDESALDRLMREEDSTAGRLILSEEQRQKVVNDKIRKQVSFELKQAREDLRTDPNSAIDRLKSMIGVLDNATDLFPENRRELRNRLESALLSSRQRKLEFDQQEAQRRLSRANSLAKERELAALARREEQLTRLINRFNSLLDEGNYEAARSVTRQALELAPQEPAAIVAAASAERASTALQYQELFEEKQRNFAAAMYEVRKASIPFPANPLMQFPDAEEWKRKKLRRAKYNSLRLTGSENDERILRALEQPATLDYDEESWSDVEQELEAKYKINIVLTQSARDDSLDVDEPITANLRGIRLKNALRLMLKEKNATFIVRDEVLQIVSIDDAESDAKYLVTNVYNVGDLVAPRFNPNGGGLAGGLGGGGGGGGLGGGGGGGFGGGAGGGGLGGGGGGGVFCIQESGLVMVRSADKSDSSADAAASVQATASTPEALVLPLKTSEGMATTWTAYFGNVFADPQSVRLTVRELMKEQKTDEVVSLILAAIEHDQRQEWMYEALTLAMQIAERPRSEIERALMSAVDLSSDVNDMLYAAHYMAHHNMEKRAIGLCKDIARAYPTRTEPILMGLRAANRIEDADGIRWATVGVYAHEWPEHPEVIDEARRSADALRLRLQQAGDSELLTEYEQELKLAKRRDCFAKVSWTGDADLDVYVQEPGGTVCSRLKPRTRSGGVMLGDEFSSGVAGSGEMAEYYILPKGFSGEYKLHVRRIWGEVTAGKVTVEIYSNYNSADQVGEVRQIDLNDPGFSVVFNVENGRRTESLETHAIASVVQEQVAASRNILAQQIDGLGGGTSIGGFDNDVRDFDRLIFGRNRLARPVGYRPIIQLIQTGTNMTVNHATTADRLYVLVSVTPLFNDIVDVFTFNSAGGADDAQGGGGGGLGGGAGGGGAF